MKGDGYFYLKMELLEIVYLGYPRYKFLFLMTAFQQLDAVSHQTKGTFCAQQQHLLTTPGSLEAFLTQTFHCSSM